MDTPPTPPGLPLPDADATDRLGRWLAPRLAAGDTVLLDGPVGAGKTHLARALIRARGVAGDIPSPTYTLVQTYGAGPVEIWHADLYRLTHPDEVAELGLEDAFAAAICLVEWPDRLGPLRPEGALHLRIGGEAGGEGRRVTPTGGPRWAGLIADMLAGRWADA